MKNIIVASALALCSFAISAQDFSAMKYRELGPYRGGRVTTVAGTVQEPGTFYSGATGGGVWKTTDYGTTWKNVSDGFFKTPSIGAVAVAQNDPNIVYVGTGTDGLRSNVIEGKGMYKSIDGGESWSFIGLEKVGQIGAVRIHPTNHNIVYVAAIGRAFIPNAERGIYKTEDGGKSWEKVLFVSNAVGFSDVEMLPSNPNILFASAWKAKRTPWNIESGGNASEGGLYKSVDAGKTWDKVTQGLPSDLIGKIDIETVASNSRMIYALVEAVGEKGGLYKSVDQGERFSQVSNDRGIRTRPFYYTNVRVNPQNPEEVYVLATGYYKSTDGGKNWKRVGTPHGDNHDIWFNPENPDIFIQSNDGGANVTMNGGETWSTQLNQPTSEIYQVEVDDQYPYWVYGGMQDNYSTVAVPTMAPYGVQVGGLGYIINAGGCETGPAVPKPGNADIVYSNCKGRFSVFNKKTGTEKSYYVGASNMYGHNPKELKYRFQRVSPIHVSPHDPNIVYHCSQFVHRTTDEGKTWETISPDLTAFEADKQVISGTPITRDITGEEFYSTIYAIRESPVETGLIWVGANDGPVHMTRNGGETWKNVTPKSLPRGGRVDAVEPSPHDPGKAYISVLRYQLGDQKPYIYKTEDYGQSWTLITTGNNGIPADHPTRVVREDPVRAGLLFAGTEYGIFMSRNDGSNWEPFQQNLPVVPITDIKIFRSDLVMSTMGRGFWALDDLSPVRQQKAEAVTALFEPRKTVRSRYPSGAWGSQWPKYPRPAAILSYYLKEVPDNPIKLTITDSRGEVVNTFISDTTKADTEVTRDMSTENVSFIVDKGLSTKEGLNRFHWDMTHVGPWTQNEKRRYQNGPMAGPGVYDLELEVDGNSYKTKLELELDPRVVASGVKTLDITSQLDLALKVRGLLSEVNKEVERLETAMKEAEENGGQEGDTELAGLKSKLQALKTKSGFYHKPMLRDQISYLYNMLRGTDQMPGNDAYDRYDELKKTWEELN